MLTGIGGIDATLLTNLPACDEKTCFSLGNVLEYYGSHKSQGSLWNCRGGSMIVAGRNEKSRLALKLHNALEFT
jgi:hypothetical protein